MRFCRLLSHLIYDASVMREMCCSCKWPGVDEECTAEDFQMVFTDFGLCYSINVDEAKRKYVDSAG